MRFMNCEPEDSTGVELLAVALSLTRHTAPVGPVVGRRLATGPSAVQSGLQIC